MPWSIFGIHVDKALSCPTLSLHSGWGTRYMRFIQKKL